MPKPHPSEETESEWMSRCIPVVLDDGTADDQDMAVAICLNMWRDAKKKKDAGMLNRAYSILEVRSVSEDKRIIRGMATSPSPDRMGDIVEPLGVKFKNPLPLLLFHQHDKPVGHVRLDKPTKDGITFEASIPKIEEPGTLRDRVEEAWQSVKSGLVAGVSIGFRSLEKALMDTGGIHFIASEILELSLVSVPANADATIQTIKSLDTGASAKNISPGASGTSEKGRSDMKSLSEQIAAKEATRAAKSARMEDILQKAFSEDRSTDDAEKDEFDELEDEVKEIDGELRRLHAVERNRQAQAKPIDDEKKSNGSSRPFYGSAKVKDVDVPPGIRFARVIKVKALSYLTRSDPIRIAENLYGSDRQVVETIKADVPGGVTDPANLPWAGALVQTDGPFADFAEWLRPQTIIGKFGVGGIPALRRVPFRVGLVGQTSGGSGYWVGESQPKPLTKFDFTRTTMTPLKVANITVLSEELIRDSSPSAETIIRDQLAAALQERLDIDFIDPAQTAVPGVEPNSITQPLTPIPSTGVQIAAVREDIRALIAAFVTANNPPTNGVFIMSALHALALSIMQNPLGQAEFPTINMNGGSLFGMPVITSQYIPDLTAGGYVVLVNASDVYVADEGGISVDVSREASLQMDDAPTNQGNSPGSPMGTTETTLVSMWQTNNVAFRAERTINWMLRRESGAAMLSGVNWGEAGSP